MTDNGPSQELAVRPRSVLVDMSERYGMEPGPFEATLRATVCKGSITREEFAAFLMVAKEYRLNPLTKEIYAFPAKGGGIQPIVSIDGWCRIINEHPAMDGVEFDDDVQDGSLVSVTCRIFRKDRARPTVVTEYMAECRRSTDVWKTWPARMLRHKALIQGARYAFGFSGIVDPDEYERITEVRDVTPAKSGVMARLKEHGHQMTEGFSENRVDEALGTGGPVTVDAIDAVVEEAVAAQDEAQAAEFDPETGEVDDDDFPGDRETEIDPLDWATQEGERVAAARSLADLDLLLTADAKRQFDRLHEASPAAATALESAMKGKRKALKSMTPN